MTKIRIRCIKGMGGQNLFHEHNTEGKCVFTLLPHNASISKPNQIHSNERLGAGAQVQILHTGGTGPRRTRCLSAMLDNLVAPSPKCRWMVSS